MIQRHSKCRIAALLSLSVILSSSSMASATSEKQGRVLLRNRDSAVNSIANAAAFKTDDLVGQEVTGDGKSIGVDYTLYNYGGSAVLSLTKDKTTGLNFNDTQASTLAALGNAALILGGALLFGQLNNRIQSKVQQNLYSRNFKPQTSVAAPAVRFRKRRLRNRFRKRRLPAQGAYSQRNGRYPVGGRRRLRKNFQAGSRNPQRLQNHRIQEQAVVSDFGYFPQTRDQVSVPLSQSTYAGESSILDPVKPMLYDPYLYEDPAMMEDYNYYDDYYDAMPNTYRKNQIQTKSQPPMPAKKPIVEPSNSAGFSDYFADSRTPSRNEMLLKMSEEKRLEKLQKERAKLLEATLMKPNEMEIEEVTPLPMPAAGFRNMEQDSITEPEKQIRNTRARIPLRQMRQRKPQPELQGEMSPFDTPRAAFQTTFQRPVADRDVSTEPVNDPFSFRQDVDPFKEMSTEFDVNNDDWISTISEAFEGFSDFKKLKK